MVGVVVDEELVVVVAELEFASHHFLQLLPPPLSLSKSRQRLPNYNLPLSKGPDFRQEKVSLNSFFGSRLLMTPIRINVLFSLDDRA
jgi:hypothetical protein